MADRREKIILGLDAGPYVRGLATASTATKAFVKELDSSDSRMGNLVQTSLALGPALVPIGAAAVPAVAALTAGLGAAAGAAGVAALAFNGIGDGLKALNDYQLEPSTKNLEAVRQAFEDIGPAGANFVLFLDKLEPKLDRLQNTAREGLLPGVEEGIRSLIERGPQVERIIAEISGALGDLAAEGGEGLAGPKFRDFFDYIEDEARPILTDMGRTLGNVAEGLSNMLVGLGPATNDFSTILLGLARDFAEWSRNLESNAGFQEFLDYVQRVSPKALDTLGSVALALGDIVEAAAPVGEATLPIIKAVAETLSAVAESPAGPVLIGAAAGISALSRAVALFNVANGSALVTSLGNARKEGSKLASMLSPTGALVGGVGALALSFTDLDEEMGLSNAAMGAMLGLVAGPWGAAIGGGIGLVKDFADANDELENAVSGVDDALRGSDFTVFAKSIRDARREIADARDGLADFGSAEFWFGDPRDAASGVKNSIVELFTDGIDEAKRETSQLGDSLLLTFQKLRKFTTSPEGGGFENFTMSMRDLERFASRAQPALRRMGISLDDLRNTESDSELRRIAAGIRSFVRESDSVPGRAKDVRKAIRQLDSPLVTAADSAEGLESALSSLFDPNLNAREALIEWKNGLVELRKQIRGTTGSLDLNTAAGRDNQSAIIGQIRKLEGMASAQAEAGASAKTVAKTLRNGRKDIIDAADAAGLNRRKVRGMIDALVNIPDIVSTRFKTPGSKDAIDQAETLDGWVRTIPDHKDVKTDAPGIGQTTKDAEGLAHLINDTIPDSKKIDTSAPGANRTRDELNGVDKAVRTIDGKTVDVRLSTNAARIVSNVTDLFTDFFANGGIIEAFADGGMRENHVAQIAQPGAMRIWAEPETGGEAYIPLAPAKRDRSLDIWAETGRRLGVDGFADGGLRINTAAQGDNLRKNARDIDAMFEDIAAGIGDGLGKALSKQVLSLGGGFHWPLPRRYGPSGTWGSYASGGSHPALDWPAPLGTPIFATLPGKVADVQHLSTSYGNHVVLSHGRGLESISAHMDRTAATEGARVMPGETIGYVDSTGNSTGNHLHLEFRRNGVPINYTSWLSGGGPRGGFAPGIYDGDHKGLNMASPAEAMGYARSIMGRWGWGAGQWPYWQDLGNRESGWRWNADNPTSSAYGIPQALPGSKMASSGPDWRTNAGTQVDWMAGYIRDRYGTPAGAIAWHNAHNWYADGGIRTFDNGGIWKHGQLGVNLSGRDEYVNDPNATAAAMRMADGGLIEAFSAFVKWAQRSHEGINFPEYLGLSDKEQAILDRSGSRFNLGGGMDRSQVRSEINDLIGAVEDAFSGGNESLVGALKRFKERAVDITKSLEAERRERDKLRDQLQATRQKARDFSNTVAGNFQNDPFGGSLDEFFTQTRADRNDARRGKRLRNRAERLGLDGPLARDLLASGNLDLLAEIVRGGKSEVRKAERAYESSRRAANRFGNSAADLVFGKRIAQQTNALEKATIRMDRLTQRLEGVEDKIGDRVEEGARKGTKDGVQGKNNLLHQMSMEVRG